LIPKYFSPRWAKEKRYPNIERIKLFFRADFCAGSPALPGEQCARAPRPKLVCRSRFDLLVLRDPHAAAGQNARLCRFRPGGFSAGSLGRTLRGKSRIGLVRLSLRPSLRLNATAMAIWAPTSNQMVNIKPLTHGHIRGMSAAGECSRCVGRIRWSIERNLFSSAPWRLGS
jgi:hypothetical protein